MFTGIIEAMGAVHSVQRAGANTDFWIEAPICSELRIDQSVAHNGACLTVVELKEGCYRVTAVDETLRKTNLGGWQAGTRVNLERSLRIGDRLDGHFVQGHVDTTGRCVSVQDAQGSWLFRFSFPDEFAPLLIEKGSICVNGVSLTAFEVSADSFSVAIIPYTYAHTGFHALQPGEAVNLEFDVLGKYLLRREALATLSGGAG